MTCGEARRIILAVVRRQATDAERLRLDEHLAGCAACLQERGQAALLERLRDQPAPRVSASTRARILELAAGGAQADGETADSKVRGPLWRLLPALAMAAALALFLGGRALRRSAPEGDSPLASPATAPASPPPASPAPLPADTPGRARGGPRLIAAERAGEVPLDGALVRYPAASVLRVHEGGRRVDLVDLVDGEVDVEVTPGGRERFRVVTPRFVVEVVGTRFFVRRDGVQTVHGVVRVLDLEGRELAVVRGGESWKLPSRRRDPDAERPPGAASLAAPPAAPAAPPSASAHAAAPPVPAGPVSEPSAPRVSGDDVPGPQPGGLASRSGPQPTTGATTPTAPPSAAALLQEARTALSRGDAAFARERLAAALASRPDRRQRAVADLLAANALLVEGRPDRAVEAWRDVAARHADQPEAETALFAAAQLLSERGPPAAARAALEDYLRRHPEGHFAGEVREKLGRLPPANR